jgi:Arc/MetJ-type ribon-helix-helix transcriptional regulator
MKLKNIRIKVSFPHEMTELLDKIAKDKHLSRSEVVRKAIEWDLARRRVADAKATHSSTFSERLEEFRRLCTVTFDREITLAEASEMVYRKPPQE